MIVLPSAFTYQTGVARWELLIRARAVGISVIFLALTKAECMKLGGEPLVIQCWLIRGVRCLFSAFEGEKIIYAIINSDKNQRLDQNFLP